MAEHLVKLETISKIYGDYRAVDGISLDIKEGEFLTLLGPSGCGKTTTLRMIAGFETPTKGDVLINDKVVNKVPPYKREINTVFQQYALFPHMTIYNNVAFGLKMKKVSKKETEERVNKVLDLVQLNEFKNRKPDQLSGGQKQRVAIARAIVNNPEVLLLDEPLGALDLKLRKQMQLELKHLQQTLGITFIYVTHDQEEALTMSDRIVVLNEGKIEQVDTPKELYERPKTLFVANFIGETNNIKGIVEAVNGDLMTVSIGGDSVVLDNDHHFDIGDEVNACIRPEKIKFVETDTAEDSRLQVTLREYIYVGSITKAVVILADGQEVKVQLAELNGLKEGDTAHIHWNNDDCIVYDDKEITV